MGEIDQSFKRLFLLRVDALLQWLLGDVRDVQPVLTDLATERQLVPDTLYRAIFEGEPCLVNVEMPRCLYLYAARATSQYKLPTFHAWNILQTTPPSIRWSRCACVWACPQASRNIKRPC